MENTHPAERAMDRSPVDAKLVPFTDVFEEEGLYARSDWRLVELHFDSPDA
jgi:hypothetical protein